MNASEKIELADPSTLRVIRYPDPRLTEVCSPIETIDAPLIELIEAMWGLMLDSRGVGLAAPQVGITVRLFAATPSFSPDDLRVYINPRIIEESGSSEEEEGCLSFPQVYARVKRSAVVTVEAMNLQGEIFQETCSDLHARIIQHELDHLDGRLLVDRMGTVAKLTNRRALKTLEAEFDPA
ncbi:MAG: peptide deformylase [Phycisphaerales bacterium]|jgi:peptide deformylase|nr:peptide deformylase [Phycisphaerales bacterium]